jgi:hypothetical protein
MLAAARCLTFGSSRVDSVLAHELLRAVEPIAVEAAMAAERLRMERVNERRHMLELDLQKARYEASLAERRYAAIRWTSRESLLRGSVQIGPQIAAAIALSRATKISSKRQSLSCSEMCGPSA